MFHSLLQASINPLLCVQETDNPDLRDRAFVYWRLLSTDPEAAKDVVLAEKPVIADSGASMEPALLATLLSNLSTLASVYHKPPEVSDSCVNWQNSGPMHVAKLWDF